MLTLFVYYEETILKTLQPRRCVRKTTQRFVSLKPSSVIKCLNVFKQQQWTILIASLCWCKDANIYRIFLRSVIRKDEPFNSYYSYVKSKAFYNLNKLLKIFVFVVNFSNSIILVVFSNWERLQQLELYKSKKDIFLQSYSRY